jgi:DNA-binding response OmpR family regulator
MHAHGEHESRDAEVIGEVVGRAGGSCSVLVIDDDLDMVEMVSAGLTALGYDVDTATDGRKAVEMARKKPYHVAVADLRMPVFDGIMTLLTLKECAPDVDVVIVTAYGTEATFKECKQKGASHCMNKPFTTEELAAVIESLLARRKAAAER